ncbi:hypothetical protein SETIT_6G118500v2, partial [Setaria italica]
KDRSIHGIRSYHGCYDALSYPLFFPRGELEWHNCIPKVGSAGNKCVSMRDYYCYKFQMRPGIFNPILYGKRLFQQFAVDTYVKIESSRLDYIRNNQDLLRANLYQGLVDSWRTGVEDADEVGKRTVLSPTFIEGPRNMRRQYMDAMALVQKFGKPDIFLTMMCNPNWDEIKNELYPGQSPQDCPDLVTRVFRAKLEEFKRMLMEKDILGKVRAFVYVVEFQKRGLPHAHFLLIMHRKYKIMCPEQYDLLISTELPNKKKYPNLYRMVMKHMMHGPCRMLNPLCPCTRGRTSCKKRYPRPLCDSTSQGKDSYPIYRRRDNGWVIPYNPCLLHTFNCHINVEACSSIKSVKYLFKYIYKGHDRASVAVKEAGKKDGQGNIDEITQYKEARWVTPLEAMWRIYGFDLSKNHPPVQQLQLHLPDMHMVTYHKRDKIERVVNCPGADELMLTTYFDYNKLHKEARGILYHDFPEHYTWESNGGTLLSSGSPEPCCWATSYRDLRTIDGVLLPSFREAADRRGLIEEDNTHDECLTENSLFHMPSSLRRLFTTILVFCKSNDVFGFWTKHLDAMSEDYRRNNPNPSLVEHMVLIDIRNMLQSMGKNIRSFRLPGIDDTYDDASGIPHEIFEEASIDQNLEDSGTAKLLQQASLIIWDEASMAKRQAMEALDNSLRDIMGRQDLPFGGKTVVFGGVFRQESMHHLKLVRNMRTQSDPWFVEYLLRIGGGTEEVNGDGDVCLLDNICVPYSEDSEKYLDRLIECIFPNLNANMTNKDYITSRAILSTRNDWVDNINIKMIGMFHEGEMVYRSFDSAIDDPHNYYPLEFLNTLTPNGLPPHLLKLKIGCPVILLRNIDLANGLCNGTRLGVRGFQRNSIDAEIVLGLHARKRVFLPRIPLCPSDDEMFPFQFKRKQFPIRLSFAMTVNKSQGQTIPNVGVYLPAPMFSHGQLYVAMSRATARTNIKILALLPNAEAEEE